MGLIDECCAMVAIMFAWPFSTMLCPHRVSCNVCVCACVCNMSMYMCNMGVCVCVSVRYVAQYIQDGCAIFRRGCLVCPAVLWSETAVSISILHVLCCCCFVVGSRCWRRMCARGRHCAAPCVRASAVLSGCAMCVGLCGGVVVCVVACRCGRVRVFAVVIKAFRWCQVCWLCLLIEIYWGRRGPRDHLGGFLGLFEVAPQSVFSRPMLTVRIGPCEAPELVFWRTI